MGIPLQFLSDLVARFRDDEADELFAPIMQTLSVRMRSVDFAGGWRSYISALTNLAAHKELIRVMTSMENFIPQNSTASNFEVLSFLGPFLRLSPLDVTRERQGNG